MIKYKEFLVGDLFEIRPTKSYGLTNDKLLSTIGNTPVISNSSSNNGVLAYVNLEPTEEKGILTFSDTGTYATESIFYQPKDFIGYSHVQGMYPLFNRDKLTQNVALFISTTIRKAVKGQYDYSRKFNRDNVSNTLIELPIDSNGQPDWDYMERYISNIEKKLSKRIHKHFNNIGFSNPSNLVLNQEDNEILIEHNNSTFKQFYLEDLFEIKNTTNLMKSEIKSLNEKYPYITASKYDNGLDRYIDHDRDMLMEGNTIFVGGKTFTVYYQSKDYFSNDSHNLWLSLKDVRHRNKIIQLYLVGAIKRGLSWKYSWGNSISRKKIKNDYILLPVSSSNSTDPNWDLMNRYIQTLFKKNVGYLERKMNY
ncbi:restriction endonuclease subunit S [Bacillus pretiosus]